LLQISGRNVEVPKGLNFSQAKKIISKVHLLPMSEIVIDKVSRGDNLEESLKDTDLIED